ncbi:MAG: SDR family NAD(P)-dependent oxidoreductase [Pseudomonadota bacterium]
MELRNKKVLVTGGSSGIGLAIAKELKALGNEVVICGRNQDRLDSAAKTHGLDTITADISDNDDQVGLMEYMKATHKGLDILVNNAGVMHVYNFANDPKTLDYLDQEISLNCSAQLKLSYRALPLLKQSDDPALVFVSSGTAYMPAPLSLVYTGTKSLIHHFCQSLRVQIKPHGIKVFELLPPPTETGLADTVKSKVDMSQFSFMKADDVAKALVDGMKADRYEIPVGLSRIIKLASRFAPRLVFKQLSKTYPE